MSASYIELENQLPTKTPDQNSNENDKLNPDNSSQPQQQYNSKFLRLLDNYFRISNANSSFRSEIIAGLTTFAATVYILIINPDFFSFTSISYPASHIATALTAFICTLLVAFVAKMPLAITTHMGLNVFVCSSLIVEGDGLTFANLMLISALVGVAMIILTLIGIRQKLADAIPDVVKYATRAGIGVYLIFIGLQNSNIIVSSDSYLVAHVSFNLIKSNTFVSYTNGKVLGVLPGLITYFGIIFITILSVRKVKGAVLWGILVCTALFYILTAIAYAAGSGGAKQVFDIVEFISPVTSFKDWAKQAVGALFYDGFDTGDYTKNKAALAFDIIFTTLSMIPVLIIDTPPTISTACTSHGITDESDAYHRFTRLQVCEGVSTIIGAVCGTSASTVPAESTAGIFAGGRTGFSALITSLCYLVSLFLVTLGFIVPRCAIAAAFIFIGASRIISLGRINWSNITEAVTGLFTFILIPLSFNIATGLAIGMIIYVLLSAFTGTFSSIPRLTWAFSVFFLATLFL